MTGRDESGQALWIVTDAVPYPSLPAGYALAIATCEDGHKADESIVAVVRSGETEWLGDARWAQRFDPLTEKFVEHPVRDIRCRNEAAGL